MVVGCSLLSVYSQLSVYIYSLLSVYLFIVIHCSLCIDYLFKVYSAIHVLLCIYSVL